MQCVKLFLENRQHFMKRIGFYAVQPLKKNRFGIRRLFSPSHAILYIIFVVIKQV
jgi:hypothetical protein